MAENIDIGGESLANRAPVELIKALKENISSEEPDTVTPAIKTENMEVHHHTHHNVYKNWKIYLWEFIMLFLAVFCGFLAENQREYMVERKREKQYIRTMIMDIQTDLSNITNRIAEYSSTTNRIDTILNNFDSFTKDFSIAAGRNFFYIIYVHDDFIYTDRTMQQLKFAGGLRLIKASASDSIMAYDSDVKSLFNQVNYNTEIYVQLIDLANKMVSYKNAVRDNKTKYVYTMTTGKADFWIKHDPELFQHLYNQLLIYSITNSYSVVRLKILQKRGNDLIHFLKNEYHLK